MLHWWQDNGKMTPEAFPCFLTQNTRLDSHEMSFTWPVLESRLTYPLKYRVLNPLATCRMQKITVIVCWYFLTKFVN